MIKNQLLLSQQKGSIRFSCDGEPFSVEDNTWRFDNQGVRSNFNFDLIKDYISEDILEAFKFVLSDLIATETPGTTKQRFNTFLRAVRFLSEQKGKRLNTITSDAMETYYSHKSTKSDYTLLPLFQRWLDLQLPGIDQTLIPTTESRRISRNDPNNILSLHPTKGPYLDSEIIAADLALKHAFETDTITQEDFLLAMTFRLYGQRPVQVANLKLSDVQLVGESSNSQTLIRFPLAKKRTYTTTHGPARPTPMLFSTVLQAYVIERRGNLPHAQAQDLPLFVPRDNGHPRTERGFEGHCSADTLSGRYRGLMDRLSIVSPRTGAPLVCNAQRERHTAATLLAMKGCSAEEIAAWLHHDNIKSCEYYVELGVRHHQLMHSILDGRFTHLAGRFFGEVITNVDDFNDSSLITDPDNPLEAPVGGCAVGGCSALDELAAPYACLNGCPNLRLSLHANLRPLIESVAIKKRQAKNRGDSEYHESLNRHLAQIAAAENALQKQRNKQKDADNA